VILFPVIISGSALAIAFIPPVDVIGEIIFVFSSESLLKNPINIRIKKIGIKTKILYGTNEKIFLR
ncbi:MAG: hypothetical protein KA477_01615, partial [Candidatus Levybacteria bacterium]|nr:hypothetical protein [Candidatus Levybacteria bacterium]